MRRLAVLLTLFAAVAGAASARTLTYLDLLHQLTDLDRLTHLQPGVTGGAATSWDRAEHTRWGANGDAGQYIRNEANGEAVMLDVDGPGVVWRIWSANPQGKLRFYFDGAETPQWETDFAALFTGNTPPFIKPLVYGTGGRASDSYLPIPFAKHLKVCADRAHGQYYHFNYLRYPADTQLANFKLPLSAEEDAAVKAAAEAWSHPEKDPKPALPRQATITKKVTLAPGQTVTLANLTGPGVIRSLRARVACEQRSWPRKLVVKGTWDGAAWPQVLAPYGSLFGFDWTTADYSSLIAGCRDGQTWLHWPMPFHRSGKLELTSTLELPAEVTFEIDWAPQPAAADLCYFFARWRREPRSTTFDYPFLETAGHGHLVGVALQIDHPIAGWWGEGDEKLWVDDDQWPTWIGTGSEDYFGDAWGIRYLPQPSFGCSYDKGAKTCPYRWHFLDCVPFSQRLRFTIENYVPYEDDYCSTVFWYQQELTPPFAELAGNTYTGATAEGLPPSEQHYRTDLFRPITAADTRTFGLDLPNAVEAEDLHRPGDRGKVVTDARRKYEFNREQALDFGTVKTGDRLMSLTWDAPAEAVYYPTLVTSPDTTAKLGLVIRDQALPGIGQSKPFLQEMRGIRLLKGSHPMQVVVDEGGTAILDAFQFLPADRVPDAIEAEELTVSAKPGAPTPVPAMSSRQASGGRTLTFDATAAGQGYSLTLPPGRRYVLGVRALMGPDAGIVQAFDGDKPLGASFDLYSPNRRLSPRVFPLGQVAAGKDQVELRVVGKNPDSTGFKAELDYIAWQPKLLHPDTTAGIWAEVLGTRNSQYRIQDLGDRWVGGHHLWIQPSDRGATVDIAVHVPEAGDYDLAVKYTTSHDYAIVQASLDGKPLGGPFDSYTPTVEISPELKLGRVSLTAGQHVFRLTAADKNAASGGYLMGMDYLKLTKAP